MTPYAYVWAGNSGHQYKCKDVLDYPDDTYFWVQGYSADYFAIVLIFEPLPLNLETITYIQPEHEPFKANFANWSGEVKPNLSIKELRVVTTVTYSLKD